MHAAVTSDREPIGAAVADVAAKMVTVKAAAILIVSIDFMADFSDCNICTWCFVYLLPARVGPDLPKTTPQVRKMGALTICVNRLLGFLDYFRPIWGAKLLNKQLYIASLFTAQLAVGILAAPAWALDAPAPGAANTAAEAPKAFDFDAIWTGDALDDVHGGLRDGARGMSNLDFTGHWQGSAGWEGFAAIEINSHGGFSKYYSGDTQVVSNIDLPAGSHLYEAWIRNTSADQSGVTTFGMVNMNDLFDVQDVGALFLNTSHGIALDFGQSGASGHPITALGLVHEWRLHDTWRLRAAVFDAAAGDPHHPEAFIAMRFSRAFGLQYAFEAERDFEGGFIKVGHWTNTASSAFIDGSAQRGHYNGTYGQLSMTLLKAGKSDGSEGDDRGLRGWLRLGTAEATVLPVDAYTGGGLVYTGPFKGRDHDQVGLAVANARFAASFSESNGRPPNAETSFEITYQYEVKPGFIIQPDVQLVRHPSGDPAVADAEVVGLRLRLSAGQLFNK